MKGILIDDNYNLVIRNGSLAIGNNMIQCAKLLVGAWTGEFKHSPTLGGNIKKGVAGKPDPFWSNDIKKQLNQNLIPSRSVKSVDGNILIDIIDNL